jgi:uncharacterized DUF497 family protein
VTAIFDPKKDAANLKKHGVSLTEGDGVLSDPLALTIEDESAEGEQRFVTVGANTFGSLMVVVWDASRRRSSHYLGSEADSEGKKGL